MALSTDDKNDIVNAISEGFKGVKFPQGNQPSSGQSGSGGNVAGEYISANDDRIKRVQDSWRGVRPAMHYSVSREDLLVDHPASIKPNFGKLLEQGYKKAKLRAHSDYYWNDAVNEWAWTFTDDFDIMCESKAKNLASIDFYNRMTNKKEVVNL